MARYPWRFWAVALALAWSLDQLFYGKQPGVSFPLWMLIVVVGVLAIARWEQVRPTWSGLALALAALIMAGITFFRAEPLTRAVNFGGSLILMALAVATLPTGFWLHYRLVDQGMALLRLAWAGFERPAVLWKRTFSNAREGQVGSLWQTVRPPAMAVLRGFLLALPVIVLLGLLLAAADPVFDEWWKAFWKLFDLPHLVEYLFRLIYILLLTWVFAGYLLHGVLPRKAESKPDPNRSWLTPFLGWIEAVVVLLAVDALFAVFVGIQFQYFFGGQANIHLAGYTYSEYARRGFAELVFVAVISLGLYLSLGLVTRQEKGFERRVFSGLAILLMALVVVILISAFQRLALYEQAYAFTRLRTYTHVFIVWLAILLGVIILLEFLKQRGRFGLALLLTCLGFTLTLGFLSVDGFIVRANVERARQSGELDTLYLDYLSADAVPALLEAFADAELSEEIHDKLGAGLACRIAKRSEQGKKPWPSFHLGEDRATRLLLANQEKLREYRVQEDPETRGEFVQLGNERYLCDPRSWRFID